MRLVVGVVVVAVVAGLVLARAQLYRAVQRASWDVAQGGTT